MLKNLSEWSFKKFPTVDDDGIAYLAIVIREDSGY